MNFGQSSPLGIASQVWASTTRKLTGFGTAISKAEALNGTIVAAGQVQLTAGALVAFLSVGVLAGAAGSVQIWLNDGTRNYLYATVAATASGGVPCMLTTSLAFMVATNNDAVNAAKIAYAQFNLGQ